MTPAKKKQDKEATFVMSGSEPKYTGYYNKPPPLIRNNCMAYAFQERGSKDYYKQQPGDKSGYAGDVDLSSCTDIRRLIKRDYPDLYAADAKATPCKKGYSKIAVFVAPNRDFHFYRMDSDGFWSHKRGLTKVTRKDACNNPIRDPRQSCRRFDSDLNYRLACGTFCTKSRKLKRKAGGAQQTTARRDGRRNGMSAKGPQQAAKRPPRPRRHQT